MTNQLVNIEKNTILIDKHVSKRIKLRRNMLGLSQSELGKFLGLTFQQIQKYENAVNRVSAGRLRLMADILKVPVAWFYEGAEETTPLLGVAEGKQAALEGVPPGKKMASPASDGDELDAGLLESRETMELIRAYYAVKDQRQRKKVMNLVKTMADM